MQNDIVKSELKLATMAEAKSEATLAAPAGSATVELREEVRQWMKVNGGVAGMPWRSCWNCNPAHEWMKTDTTTPYNCFECGHIYFKGVRVSDDESPNDKLSHCRPTASVAGTENMSEPKPIEAETRGGSCAPATGSADNLRLSNNAKIRACNFFHAMQKHLGDCDECCLYLYHGDGDLCEAGKTILARELVYTDMSIECPPNDGTQRRRDENAPLGTDAQSRRSLE